MSTDPQVLTLSVAVFRCARFVSVLKSDFVGAANTPHSEDKAPDVSGFRA